VVGAGAVTQKQFWTVALPAFITYNMFYTLHVVEPLRYDSVLIKETNELMNE